MSLQILRKSNLASTDHHLAANSEARTSSPDIWICYNPKVKSLSQLVHYLSSRTITSTLYNIILSKIHWRFIWYHAFDPSTYHRWASIQKSTFEIAQKITKVGRQVVDVWHMLYGFFKTFMTSGRQGNARWWRDVEDDDWVFDFFFTHAATTAIVRADSEAWLIDWSFCTFILVWCPWFGCLLAPRAFSCCGDRMVGPEWGIRNWKGTIVMKCMISAWENMLSLLAGQARSNYLRRVERMVVEEKEKIWSDECLERNE